MSDANQKDLSKFLYEEYLNDKKSCEEDLKKTLQAFMDKYDADVREVGVDLHGWGDKNRSVLHVILIVR